ncbi:ABC transporter ATP-binding protein [Acetatifactor muris]|uniref:ABC transporter ATP-binding protein n=1 Tax=Acetatifactor muris TaxID=879566 RepID=UPI0023F52B40|nr:ABC transporter ATP-binding protein [Acetatifactor muris]
MKSKKKEKKKELSWREVFSLNKRAVLLWCRECPMLFVSAALHSVLEALVPYLTLYFSARLLDELAGLRRPELLQRWVIVLLTADAVAYLLKALVGRWKQALASVMYYQGEVRISRKLLTMDFCAADDASTHELLSRIHQREMWSGWGLGKIYEHFECLMKEMFRIAGAAVLTVSLFRLPVPEQAGWLTVLNSPLFILLLVLVMAGVTILSPWLATMAEMRVMKHDETQKLGNRIYFFCMDLFRQERRASDMRIYRQDVYGIEKIEQVADFKNGINSGMARDARGWMGCLFALSAAASRLFLGVVYLFVCLKAWGGAFGVGAVTQYIGGITAFSTGFAGVLKVIGEARVNSDTLKMIFEFLDIPNEMYQGSLTVEKRSDRKYEVEFRNVSFRYPNTESWVLKNVSLKFKVGERLAVVGQNGSGKTTFIKLLCRLYDPTEGEILLNGIDIRKYNYQEYLGVFSVVFQDFQLLAVSLLDNVAAGSIAADTGGSVRKGGRGRKASWNRQDYDRERAVRCVERAGLSDWLAARPEGLDTILFKELDDKGVQLSGGEAQKVAIARSLYHDAPFIILDEPTAALDPVAEYEIYTKFNEIVGDRTAVYISHRLASCRFCDEIVVFHEGSILQRGKHETLLAQEGGKYRELWNAQAQYYTKEQPDLLFQGKCV